MSIVHHVNRFAAKDKSAAPRATIMLTKRAIATRPCHTLKKEEYQCPNSNPCTGRPRTSILA